MDLSWEWRWNLNGDGKADPVLSPVFTTSLTEGALSVALGNGDGTFQPATTYSVCRLCQEFRATGPLAPGAISSAFGEHMAQGTAAASGNLTTSLGGVGVTIQDSTGASRPAQLFFVSPDQINFLVPAGTALGPATVNASGSAPAKPLTAAVQISAVAPALFSVGANIPAAYAVQVSLSGTQTTVPVYNVQGGSNRAHPY